MQQYLAHLVLLLTFALPFSGWSMNQGTGEIPDATQQVVGGVDALIDDYPWMAALVSTSIEGNTRQFCGATAIAPYWVLTAGHCVDGSASPESFKIVFGTADLENEETAQVFYPKTILIHSDYINSYTKDNDIALIQLREPLPDSIPKVPLATDLALEMPGVTARLIGWGLTNSDFRDGQDTLILQQVDLSIVTQDFANLPEYYDGRVHENVIPAGDLTPYHSSGSGDSGGPLLSFNDALNRWEQIGISNYGAGCNKQENPISAFARVSTHMNWINDILENDYLSWTKTHELPDLIYNDGDEHRPLQEYILGLDPKVIDHPQIGLTRTTSDGESLVTGTFRIRNSVPPLHLSREYSHDLDDWRHAEVNHEEITKEPLEASNFSLYHVPISSSEDNPGFYRIEHVNSRGIIHGPHTIRVGSSVKGLFNYGTKAYGLTYYDYLIDTMDSTRAIRVTAESSLAQAFSIKIIERETGNSILAWSESGHPDSPAYPFSDLFWPEEGKQYLLRVSSLDWDLPQDFEVRLDHVEDHIDLNTFEPHVGNLTADDHSYKRLNHFADTFIAELAAETTFNILVQTPSLDQLIFIHDANTGELIHEVDEKPAGETESVLVRFEKYRTVIVTVASFDKHATGEYVIHLTPFSDPSSLRPGESTIGLISGTENTTEISGTTYYLEEIDLENIHHPAGVSLKLVGYDSYYPSFIVYDLTAGETIHSAVARCDDEIFHFNPTTGSNYRFVLFAPPSRLGDNYELKLIQGEIEEAVNLESNLISLKQEKPLPSESDLEWPVLHQVYENFEVN